MNDNSQPAPPSYRGMLAVVIILGVLIVLALGALVGGAIMRGRLPVASQAANTGAAAYAARVAAPGETLESASADGGRIVLRFSGSAGSGGEIVVLDAATGRVIGRIAVDTGP